MLFNRVMRVTVHLVNYNPEYPWVQRLRRGRQVGQTGQDKTITKSEIKQEDYTEYPSEPCQPVQQDDQ